MPWFSYHGAHSGEFCGHAKDRLEQVVERAIAEGFTHYGLSEHGPRFRAQDLFPEEREEGVAGLAAKFERYAAQAHALRERYADRIELIVGFETEKLPPRTWASDMRAVRERHGFEYMVGSVHDLDGRWVDYDAATSLEIAEACGGVEAMQARYFDSLTELVDTLQPEIVGHVDLVRKFDGMQIAFAPAVWPHIDATLEAARAAGSRLDVNAGAYRRGLSPVYPLPSVLARAREMGVGVTLGDDGHGVGTVGVGLDECVRVVAEAGYREIDYLTRRDGAVVWESAPIEQVLPRR